MSDLQTLHIRFKNITCSAAEPEFEVIYLWNLLFPLITNLSWKFSFQLILPWWAVRKFHDYFNFFPQEHMT